MLCTSRFANMFVLFFKLFMVVLCCDTYMCMSCTDDTVAFMSWATHNTVFCT
jgi:hypothetical protein